MKDIKSIVANNLIALRKSRKMTQADVAEKLNYSDKSVSKWEHADSLPDISILYALADMYGVTLDYLTSDNAEEQANMMKTPEKSLENDRIIVASLTVTSIFLIAALIFVYISERENFKRLDSVYMGAPREFFRAHLLQQNLDEE